MVLDKRQVVKDWTKLVDKIKLYDWEVMLMRIACIVILIAAFLLAVTLAGGEELNDLGRTSQDAIRPDRVNVLDKDGDIIYYFEQDRILPSRTIIYNDDGDEVGVIQPDPIRPGEVLYKGTNSFRRFND